MRENGESRGAPGWLHSLAAILGLLVGGLYALGAISIFGQLLAADVSPTQVLSLVPVEQMLARGIASLITPALYLVVIFVLLYGIGAIVESYNTRRRSQEEPRDIEQPEAKPGRLERVFAVLDGALDKRWFWLFFVLALLVIAAPPLMIGALALTFAASSAVLAIVLLSTNWNRDSHWNQIFATWMVTMTLSGAITTSFLDANPLPRVVLEMKDGEQICGGLALEAGDTWYLKSTDNQLTVVPARNVRSSTVSLLDRQEERSLGDMVLGRDPPGAQHSVRPAAACASRRPWSSR